MHRAGDPGRTLTAVDGTATTLLKSGISKHPKKSVLPIACHTPLLSLQAQFPNAFRRSRRCWSASGRGQSGQIQSGQQSGKTSLIELRTGLPSVYRNFKFSAKFSVGSIALACVELVRGLEVDDLGEPRVVEGVLGGVALAQHAEGDAREQGPGRQPRFNKNK